MASAFSVEVHGTDALFKRMLDLGADAPRAATRALNKTIRTVNAAVVRGLSADTGLTQSTIRGLTFRGKPAVSIQRATFTKLFANVAISGSRLPLGLFRPRQTRTGVSFRLAGSRGTVPSGFLATMRSGHEGVFRRAEAQGPMPARRRGARRRNAAGVLMVGRLPIVERFGPSLPQVMRTKLLAPQVAAARETFAKNLDHEIKFILSQRVPAGDE